MWQDMHVLLTIGAACLLSMCGICAASDGVPAGQRRIVAITAPPCGGAGTQSPNIVHALGVPHLDCGAILREAAASGTELGLEAKRHMDSGGFVPDNIVEGIVAERMRQPDCAKGVLLDGFPRNLHQAAFLDAMLAESGEAVTDMVTIAVPKAGLQECVLGRWGASNGNSYNSRFIGGRRPKSLPLGATPVCDPKDLEHCNMRDDDTGEPLAHRSDDNLNTLDKRLKEYHSQTKPILAHYKRVLISVDGNRPEPEVWADIAAGLGVPASAGIDMGYFTKSPGVSAMRLQESGPTVLVHVSTIMLLAPGALGFVAIVILVRCSRTPGRDVEYAPPDYRPFPSSAS